MTTPRRPPGRYDEPTTLSQPVLVGGGVLLVVALTAATWLLYDRYRQDRVSWKQLYSTVVSDTETKVEYQVRTPDERDAVCRLNAVDENRAEVGTAEITVDSGSRTVVTMVPTTRRAAVGQVLSCRVAN